MLVGFRYIVDNEALEAVVFVYESVPLVTNVMLQKTVKTCSHVYTLIYSLEREILKYVGILTF